jgi:hypothetical protein
MKITKSIVQTLLDIINPGLCHGAGDMDKPGSFCVQQAVSHAVGRDEHGDNPHECVGDKTRSFGVQMNDCDWLNEKTRANGMRRFAVAEMGSNKVSQGQFNRIVCDQWNKIAPYGYDHENDVGNLPQLCQTDKDREKLCEMAVKALIILETEGSKFLYMTELPKKEQQKIADRYCVPQLQWRGFTSCNAVQGQGQRAS